MLSEGQLTRLKESERTTNERTDEQFRPCTKRSEYVENERNGATREMTQMKEMAVSASWNRYQQNERR